MSDLESRVNELEIKFSYQDELLNELNLLVAKQQEKLDEMTEFLKHLSETSDNNSSLKNEKPPHY